MGYSVTRPLFWLQDHNEHKRGEPVGKLALIAVARVKMLCAQGIVGTEDDLVATACKVEVKVVEVVKEEEVLEEVVEPEEVSAPVLEEKKDYSKKKGK
jgi:hypothetical protein